MSGDEIVGAVHVRQATHDDIAQLVNLQFEVYPPPAFPPINRWDAGNLESHMEVFPEGQLVAVIDERIVGAATTMIVASTRASRPHSFDAITGGNDLKAHDAAGDALYGVDLLVSPAFRGRGVARALYEARFALQRARGLPHFYMGSRIPGYGAVADELGVLEYVADVVAGRRSDDTLSVQLHFGFEVIAPMADYLPDPETANYAILVDRPLPEDGAAPRD
jgi:ribosomal protein S18 acetylase RimI-like enzyme